MKKIIIFLIIGLGIITSCSKDDPKPTVKYSMPHFTADRAELMEHLQKITANVVETKKDNVYTITCKPEASDTNMFSEMVYTYRYDGFNLDEFTFSYKIDNYINISPEDEVRLQNFLKNNTVELQ